MTVEKQFTDTFKVATMKLIWSVCSSDSQIITNNPWFEIACFSLASPWLHTACPDMSVEE